MNHRAFQTREMEHKHGPHALEAREPTDNELAAALCNAWCDDLNAWRELPTRDRTRWLEVARVARATLDMPQAPVHPLHSRREQLVYREGWVAGFHSRERDARVVGLEPEEEVADLLRLDRVARAELGFKRRKE